MLLNQINTVKLIHVFDDVRKKVVSVPDQFFTDMADEDKYVGVQAFAGTRVRFTFSEVECLGNEPQRIVSIETAYLAFLDDGVFDIDDYNEYLHCRIAAIAYCPDQSTSSPLYGSIQFYKNRYQKNYQWKMTTEEADQLSNIIFNPA